MFNVRAWLYYEAGRRADLDLSSLTSEGNFAARPVLSSRRPRGLFRSPSGQAANPKAAWWARAAAHARSAGAADYYAVATVKETLPSADHAELSMPTWVSRATVLTRHAYAI